MILTFTVTGALAVPVADGLVTVPALNLIVAVALFTRLFCKDLFFLLLVCGRKAFLELLLTTTFYYRPQTKFAKVMFLHLSVSHSVHRGGACVARGRAWQGVCMARGAYMAGGTCMAGGGHVWQEGMHGRGHVWGREGVCMAGGCACHAHPPDTMRYGRLVNARAVRILLECIIVENKDRINK